MEEEKDYQALKYHLFPTDYRLLFRIFAVFVSWYYNGSVLWGLLHFFFGWIYLVYVMMMGGFSEGGLGDIIKYYIGN
jgi:hypothetical protein